MDKLFSEEQKKEIEKKSAGLDFLLDMIADSEDAPIDFKLMKAHKDLGRSMHDLMANPKFLKMKDDEPKKAVLNILQQAIETVKDATKKMEEI